MRSVATYKVRYIKATSVLTFKHQEQWLTAFPQIVSRIDHSNKSVYDLLSNLIIRVLQEYPHQGLWLFMSVVQSKKPERSMRGGMIINKLTVRPYYTDGILASYLFTIYRVILSMQANLYRHLQSAPD
jgi:hypothetical protein